MQTPTKVKVSQNLSMKVQEKYGYHGALCPSMNIHWRKQGVTMCSEELRTISWKTLRKRFIVWEVCIEVTHKRIAFTTT